MPRLAAVDGPALRELLNRQCGVIGRTQAIRLGLTGEAWQWRLDKGLWSAVLPGVAVAQSGRPDDAQRAWAAQVHGGRGAALSGDVALVQAGFVPAGLREVDVVVPEPRRVRGHGLLGGPILRTHTVRDLPALTDRSANPRRTFPDVAALHAAAWASTDRSAEWRLAATAQQRLATAGQMRTRLLAMPSLPRRALMFAVLDDVELGAHAASELAYLRFCRRHGLPVPDELQVAVRAGGLRYLDARYRKQRVAVEIDGAHHMRVGQWDADALRSLQLAASTRGSGEVLVRITSGNLRHDADQLAVALRTLLL